MCLRIVSRCEVLDGKDHKYVAGSDLLVEKG